MLKVNHSNLAVIIDSRSPLNILDKKLYTNIKPTLPLAASTTKIFAYWSKQPLPLLGTFKATVTVNHQQTTAKFYVTKGSSGTLLRKKTAESLDLLHICPVKTNTIQQHLRTNQLVAYNATSPHHYPPKASEPSTDHIVQACSDVFHKNRELKNYKLQLYINHAVTLVQQPVRKIPLCTRKKVEKELQRLLDLDIIEKVNWPNKLVKNPIVPITKTNQTI